jgi:transcriptional regulator with XRE-family HTH domain
VAPPKRKSKAIAEPDPVDLAVGAAVRALRREKGMVQADLAQAIGVTYQQLQKYERGTNRISASMLDRIATALGAEVADLFALSPPRANRRKEIDADLEGEGAELMKSLERVKNRKIRQALALLISRMAARK